MLKVINILTMNCRGLQDVGKRKDVFHYLRGKNASILCLQVTHFSEKDYKFSMCYGCGTDEQMQYVFQYNSIITLSIQY